MKTESDRRPERQLDRVLSFKTWCEVNGFSVATGRRIVARGQGSSMLKLSERKLGVRESDNRAWQNSRVVSGS
jgi:predicted DNA-binding transcriptional regulator AlpA